MKGQSLRRYTILPSHILLVVDIDFDESKLALPGVLVGQFLDERSDLLAGATPVGVKVGDDVGVRSEDCVEVALRVDANKLRHGYEYCGEMSWVRFRR